MSRYEAKPGDHVRYCQPGAYEREGTVMETDYHPLPWNESKVLVKLVGEIGTGAEEWVDARYVFPDRSRT